MKDDNTTLANEICEDCVIPQGTQTEAGMCVTCPFCHKVVNAIVTDSYIQCPACQAKVTK